MTPLHAVGDMVVLRSGSDGEYVRTSESGYRGFLRTVSGSRISVSRKWVGPRNPDAVGIVVQHLNDRGTFRARRIIILWEGEILDGCSDDFVSISSAEISNEPS